MKIRKAWCLFEQSGTFKNEFIKLGIPAEDFDILNDFGETNNVVDLYHEIEEAYSGGVSIFDRFSKDDIILAFFPCTRFENQILLEFRGDCYQAHKWNKLDCLEYDLKLHKELSLNYELITKLAIVCLRKGLRLVFENPYSSQHYLQRYWCLKPQIIDRNRWGKGDYYVKPTQYWFIGCEPENNLIMDGIELQEKKTIFKTSNTVERSMIHPNYANRFIREYIL